MSVKMMESAKVDSISDIDRNRYRESVKVFIAQPTQGLIHHWAKDNYCGFVSNLKELEAKTNYKFFDGSVGRLFVAYAREILAERALEADMNYILWIDDDMLLPHGLFERLISFDKDIIAPLAFMRVPPFSPVMWKANEDASGYKTFEQYDSYPKDELFPVDALGFGVVLMKTDILKKIPKPWFMGNAPIGEDILFSHKCKCQGMQPYVDTGWQVQHIGPPLLIGESQYLEYRETGNITTKYARRIKNNEVVLGDMKSK
jgi:hypothetical protein